ncbi:MAG: glutathione S-transferase family protein [Rhodospirillaceae bacterium]
MRRLYYHWLSPGARLVRIAIAEKRLDAEIALQTTWERDEEFLSLNPAGEVPVLVEPGGATLAEVWTILEYLEEAYPEPSLMGSDIHSRAEVRRLICWFERKFHLEVGDPICGEKLWRRVRNQGAPDSRLVRAGRANMRTHLGYISWLIERRRWLAGNVISMADLAAAAHLSLCDYAGDVPWEDFPQAKEWYALVKCRPSFRPLLTEPIPGIRAPTHYADLDF